LSGAIAASKLLIPVIHVEAGLRSFNKSMPEEINRIVSDHLSTLLFTPTKTGLINLEREGFNLHNSPPYHADNPKVFQCGDIMYDNSLYFSRIASQRNNFLTSLGVEANNFILCTIHRNSNTDDQNNLSNIFSALLSIAEKNNIPVVLPLHPRTTKKMESLLSTELKAKINNTKNIKIIPPASFLEMIVLETNCKLILTDSGGVQKEAFYFKKPCVILRPQTEWVELVECGAAKIADSDPETIISSAQAYLSAYLPSNEEFYGDGNAASFICEKIIQFI
jgi:UDP-GlcNAc3NAcA epimerase